MQGTVLSNSRRNARVLLETNDVQLCKIDSRITNVTVGDTVTCGKREEQLFIESVHERRNCISRTYRSKTKEIAVNLDRAFIVTAVGPLFNSVFIDRVIAVAELQDIPITLLVNKIDLGIESVKDLIGVYEALGLDVLLMSAKTDLGMNALRTKLDHPDLRCITLIGVSGVGKSTILNQLVPDARTPTNEVSEKTGQGRQTTSLSFGYLYDRTAAEPLIVVDLPGVQNFGITNLSITEVVRGFSEIQRIGLQCEYSDCRHIAEPHCAVKVALEAGEIAGSRYSSYVDMLSDIDRAKPY